MSFFGLGKKKQQEQEVAEINEDKPWIKVWFSFYLNKDIPKKEVAEECMEIIEIFMNAQSFFDASGNYSGYGNPKINEEVYLRTSFPNKGFHSKALSKLFTPEMKMTEKGWNIKIIPNGKNGKTEWYKIKDLYEDLFILWQLDKTLRERYDFGEGVEASFDIGFSENKPILTKKEKLMIFEFNVEDRIKYPCSFADKIFGDTLENQFKLVRSNKSSRKLTHKEIEQRERWVKEVSKLLEEK